MPNLKNMNWLEKVVFLGHIVTKEGVAVNKSRSDIRMATYNDTPKEVRNFLRLARCYRCLLRICLILRHQ